MKSKYIGCGGLACVVLLLSACGARSEKELARLNSPDGKLVALLLQVDPGGGATVGFTNYVYLNPAAQDSRRHPLFEGYSCGPMSIAWVDDKTLKLTYYSHCHITKFDNEWWTGSDVSSIRVVELVLERRDSNF